MTTTTLHTPEGHNNFNTTGLSDEVFRKMIDSGYTVQDIERFYAQLEYRRVYNLRPEVRERRRIYNQQRAAKMSAMRSLLK